MSDSRKKSMRSFFAEHRSFLLLLAIYLVFATVMLDHYPRVWVDEPWEAATGYTLATEGKMYNPVLENYAGYDKVFLQPRLFLSLAVAPAFALFGFGPITGKLVSGACGALMLIAIYSFTKKFFSRRAALISVWFVTIETMMFISYRTIRPEIYLAAFEMFSLLLFFRGLQRRAVRDFVWSGLLCGIALWTHPNALLHICALAVVLLLSEGNKVWTSRFTWSFAGAVFVGLLPYLVYLIANDAHNSFSTFYLQLDNRTNAIAQNNWIITSMQGEWNRIAEYAQFPKRALLVLIYVIGWITAFFSNKKEARYLATIIAVHLFLSLLLIFNKTIYYSTSILPLFCILIACATDNWLGDVQSLGGRLGKMFQMRFWRQSAAVGLIALFSLNQLGGNAILVWQHKDCSYSGTIQELQSVIPPNARVWGSITFWFGFYKQPYRSQYTRLRELDSFKPEYMITGDREVWGKDFWLEVREKAEKTLQTRGTFVAEFPETCYGKLRVYRLQW
jgi:4-amino-4-deoxy-L-arabinose transferase-like glycosyltransferase